MREQAGLHARLARPLVMGALLAALAAPASALATLAEVGLPEKAPKATPSCEGGPKRTPPSSEEAAGRPASKEAEAKRSAKAQGRAKQGSAKGGKTAALGHASASATATSECLVVSRTSGFQSRIGTIKSPDVIPRGGRIVAWSISLGNPTSADTKYFNEHEGGEAEAALGILEPIQPKRKQRKKGKSKAPLPEVTYKLVAQTPLVKLEPYFGITAQFPLETTIAVKKGDVVVLTAPTWAPALALSQGKTTTWRASRPKSACTKTSEPTAQIRTGVVRHYACEYVEARLTYSATLISTP
ncbi:MAG TPA: hypothetical protein VKU89_07885 [Solirubrobacteraceae bacterium]|nr:hypothetical protein [Solirubrobacteraceae bacterium]